MATPTTEQIDAALAHLSAEYDAAQLEAMQRAYSQWSVPSGGPPVTAIAAAKERNLRALRAADPERFTALAIAAEKELRATSGYSRAETVETVMRDAAESYSAADYIGGDPVMGSIAVGHDPKETAAAQAAISQAEAAQSGKPLNEAQRATVLKAYPGADASLAGGPSRARETLEDVKNAAASALSGLWSALKWGGVVVGLVAVAVIVYEVRK